MPATWYPFSSSPDTCATGMQPGSLSKRGAVLTAQDIHDPSPDDAQEIHERSQDLFFKVLRHRGIRVSGRQCAPFLGHAVASAGSGDDRARRHAFAGRTLAQLRRRGVHAVRSFRVMLHTMDIACDGVLSGRSFEGALSQVGVRLKGGEYGQLLDLFGPEDDRDCEAVDYARFLACGCSNWSARREDAVQEAYDHLSDMCRGQVLSRVTLETQFQPEALTLAHVPGMDQHQSSEEFFNQWHNGELKADGSVSWMDFVDYYLDVSTCVARDKDFCLMVCGCWGINVDDWLAKRVFRGFIYVPEEKQHQGVKPFGGVCRLPSKKGNASEVRFVAERSSVGNATTTPGLRATPREKAEQEKKVSKPADDILQWDDFKRMLAELEPGTSHEEAQAWFTAIDEDASGDVSLEEFLNSKVMKVKRLFDQYDADNSRTVDPEELIVILQSLNDTISEEEALALFQYADLDGSGEISFCEFLENRLLKMLSIFDQFDKDRSRVFNETEMKVLIRKLDRKLNDDDVHQIYKAIDIDGGGDISFIEFVESHILRAKAIFDRYDIAGTRSLTQPKFRELLLDMDHALDERALEAIYNLVREPEGGKVRIGGFLNPNIVKLKLLFDKYDQDQSRYLDATEFRSMLQDLYKSASPEDIIVLHHTICPPGIYQGVSFTDYIRRFKEIGRKHDAIQLARRRKAKEKAKRMGLKMRST